MLNFLIPVNYFKVVVSLYVETGSSSKRNIVFYNERYCQCCPSDCVTKCLSNICLYLDWVRMRIKI